MDIMKVIEMILTMVTIGMKEIDKSKNSEDGLTDFAGCLLFLILGAGLIGYVMIETSFLQYVIRFFLVLAALIAIIKLISILIKDYKQAKDENADDLMISIIIRLVLLIIAIIAIASEIKK